LKDVEKLVRELYLKDEYLIKNPSLHEEDSPWKVSKIAPLVDTFINHINKKDEINLLDVGGGAGLILGAISTYIEKNFGIKVNKYALDLSASMLGVQKQRNPDLKLALNEDICKTSLGDKQMDLVLLIDVLEHVTDPAEALQEIKRISRFSILKVPLEDNLTGRTWNFIKRGAPRRDGIEKFGHINSYSFSRLRYQIEKHAGHVLDFYFTNVFQYFRNKERYKEKSGFLTRLNDFLASRLFLLSPGLSSSVFGDHVMVLVRCY
jgi:SAM-dependent methyltransferase